MSYNSKFNDKPELLKYLFEITEKIFLSFFEK